MFSQFLLVLWGGLFLFIRVWMVWVFFSVFCFCFSFVRVGFVLFVLFLLLDCFWCCFCFDFVFVFCYFCFFIMFFFFVIFVFWALNHPCFLVFVVLCFVFWRVWGFKGQVRWPKGPPHLALNLSYFLLLNFGFCYVLFLSFFVFHRKTLFYPQKGHLCLFFCVSLCFSLALFGRPPPFSRFLWFSCCFLFLPSCFTCQFLVLFFVFVLFVFLFQDVILFVFFCLLSSLLRIIT